MSRLVTSLCAIPSFGTFGEPVFFGGPSATLGSSSPLTDDEIAALGDRALAAPGTLTGVPDLADAWAFSSGIAVWFDGYAALYGLSRHANSGNFSMSFWYNPYDEFEDLQGGDAQPNSAVFCNSIGTEVTVDGGGHASYFGLRYTSNPVTDRSVFIVTVPGDHVTDHVTNGGAPTSVSSNATNGTAGFGTDPIDEMQGWCHIMIGIHASGGKCKLTIYVNDTAILSDVQLPNNAFWNNASPIADESWILPFTNPTFTDPDGDYGDPGTFNAPWVVGGVFNTSFPNTLPKDDQEGAGLMGAVTEMWIAPGQYIDWSNSTNREKFHKSDITGTLYAPVNIGSKGATPTGTKPQYYFTGPPAKFPINRASGSNARVWHRSAPFGFVDVLRDYTSLPGT